MQRGERPGPGEPPRRAGRPSPGGAPRGEGAAPGSPRQRGEGPASGRAPGGVGRKPPPGGSGRKPSRGRVPPEPPPARPAGEEPIRLNRYLAQAGAASRRQADELIREGRVRLNGEVVTDLGRKVAPGDRVEVGGRLISPRPYLYILLNKPKDTITTTSDERGRRTVLDLIDLPEAREAKIFPVGRLDRHTVGALLLTNDGELANRLMHPRHGVEKVYVVETEQPVKPHQIDALLHGVELEDGPAKADMVGYAAPPDQRVVGIRLREGRNRQVRRMLEALGHRVAALERVRYAGLTLTGIRRGKWRRLTDEEVRRLRRMVRLK